MPGNDSNTKSLLHMNGTDASTTFGDDAVGGTHTWTANGGTQIDTAQSKFGGASGLFDGNVDYLSTPDSDDFAFGSGDFTIDCWIKFNALSHCYFFDQTQDANNEIMFMYNNTTHTIIFYTYAAGAYVLRFSVPWAPTLDGLWHHIALVRYGNVWDIYIDGVPGTKTLVAGAYASAYPDINGVFTIQINSATVLNGWMDEYRISKGIARWTADFSAALPTEEYDSGAPTGTGSGVIWIWE